MTDVSQQAVTEGIGGALARLSASHQAVKDAAAQVYAGSAAPPVPQSGQSVSGAAPGGAA